MVNALVWDYDLYCGGTKVDEWLQGVFGADCGSDCRAFECPVGRFENRGNVPFSITSKTAGCGTQDLADVEPGQGLDVDLSSTVLLVNDPNYICASLIIDGHGVTMDPNKIVTVSDGTARIRLEHYLNQ